MDAMDNLEASGDYQSMGDSKPLHMNGSNSALSPSAQSDSGTSSGSQNGKSDQERIAALELQVSQQADELLCLKTAFAQVVRRLQEVESRPAPSAKSSSSSGTHKPAAPRSSNLLPNKPAAAPTPAATPRQLSGGASSSRSSLAHTTKRNVSSVENLNATTTHHSSSSTTASTTRTSKKIGSKEVSVEKSEGLAKMYLKGRAVTMYAPSEQKEGRVNDVGKEPSENLKLEWVFGYRGKDCRNNILVLESGELCYFAAATAVMFNTETQTQRFYQEHTDDIKSIALHPDKVTVASGQVAGHAETEGKPHVRVWNSTTLETMHVIGEGVFGRGVCCVSFSKMDGGELLCAVDESNEHVVSVWEWKSEKKITEQKGSQDPVSSMEWHPRRPGTLVMCGKSAVVFWTFAEDRLNKKSGLFEKHDKPKFVTCSAFAENDHVITGDSNGNIFAWSVDDNKIKNAIEGAHDGPIFAMCAVANNSIISGGAKDLTVSLFEMENFSKVRDLTTLPDNIGGVRQLVTSADGEKVFLGTTRNCILEGPFTSEQPQEFKSLMSGHFEQLWGAAIHPTEPKFLTCGQDKLVVLWSTETKQPLWTKLVDYPLQSVAFHPTENVAAFGTSEGKWFAMDLETQEVLTLHSDPKEQNDCIAYSPDASMLAVGSHDNGLYIYRVGEGGRKYSKMGKCFGHTSFVTHLDWSSDSQSLRSTSGDYEILYWNASSCKQNTDVQAMKDVEWATGSCVLGYNVIGIWPEGADGTDINSCDTSADYNFVASGDDFGKVKLFNYPCYTPRATPKVGNAHSSHVTRVRFLPDSRTLLSLGGFDCSAMLWKIEE
ncbi:echinoderm microtubule-associated protein-like 2 isoform X2 [Convolutriloba macropyga]|uniref:echinoderm microtubule-associated protein-like 2 isoform X2 n=1 Tax=Convolutriloba macropyga TaxID=536237 RepID=UPI003F524B4F